MCGLEASLCAWTFTSSPPMMVSHLSEVPPQNTLNCSVSCIASSRVGVKQTAKTPYGSVCKRSSIGRANAAVFPLPVCAAASTSLPSSMGGIHRCWMSVGCNIPRVRKLRSIHVDRPKSPKVTKLWALHAMTAHVCTAYTAKMKISIERLLVEITGGRVQLRPQRPSSTQKKREKLRFSTSQYFFTVQVKKYCDVENRNFSRFF